jgi:hypothetical protein
MLHRGGCHCGALRYRLETALPLAQLPLRACQCSFCRHHGALSTSDPQGRARLEFREPEQLIRYRFGLKTADFLICARCGVYVGATIEDDGRAWVILNANTLDDAAQLTQPATGMNYDGEDERQRTARRKARWTPLDKMGSGSFSSRVEANK